VDRRLTVHAGSHRQVAVVVALGLALGAAPATAAPKQPEARAAFDRGVKAYTAGDYEAASAALDESFAIEPDAETLFAWAQAERKLDHCDRAIALWERLGGFDLPDENKTAITQKIDECKEVLANQAPVENPNPADDTRPVDADITAPVEPVTPTDPGTPRHRSRWKNPVGLSLLGAGAVGLGIGTVFMIQAGSADSAKNNAATYDEFIAQRDRAKSKGRIGVVGLAAGTALVAGGLAYILTRPSGAERPPVSAWVDGHGGGLVLTGGF